MSGQGWTSGALWGSMVQIPRDFDYDSLTDFQGLVKGLQDGFPQTTIMSSLLDYVLVCSDHHRFHLS